MGFVPPVIGRELQQSRLYRVKTQRCLLTYNRKPKLNPQAIAAIHGALFGDAGTTDGALQVFTEKFPESKR